MDKKNFDLFHGFLFASAVAMLTTAGSYVIDNHDQESATASLLVMKLSALMAISCFLCTGLSFLPGKFSNDATEYKEHCDEVINGLYVFNGNDLQELQRKTVKEIETASRIAGRHAALQNFHNGINQFFNYSSLASILISAALYFVAILIL